MKRTIALVMSVVGLVALTGCETTARYQTYADGEAKIKIAQYTAQAEKYRAMAAIAANGSESAKVAAVVAMAMESNGAAQQGAGGTLAAPKDPSDTALQWAGVLVPATVQGYAINANKGLGLRQSDNQTALGITHSNNNVRVTESNNNTFLGLGSMIPAAPIVTTTPNGSVVDRPQPTVP